MSIELIVIIASFLVSWLIFKGLVNIIKTSVGTAFKIALIVLALQLTLGIAPQDIWTQITQLPQIIQQFFQN